MSRNTQGEVSAPLGSATVRILSLTGTGDVLAFSEEHTVPGFVCCKHTKDGHVAYRLRTVCRSHRLLPTGDAFCNYCGMSACHHELGRHNAAECPAHVGCSSACCNCYCDRQVRQVRVLIANALQSVVDEEHILQRQVAIREGRQPATPFKKRGGDVDSVRIAFGETTDPLCRRVYPACTGLRLSQVAGYTCLLGAEAPTGCSAPGVLTSRGLVAPKQFCVVQGCRPLPTLLPVWPGEGGVCTVSPEGFRTYSVLAAGIGTGIIRVPSSDDDLSGDLCSPEIVLGTWSGRGLAPTYEVWRLGKREWSLDRAAIYSSLCTVTHAYEARAGEIDFSGAIVVAATAISVVAAALHLAGYPDAREIALRSSTGPVEHLARARLAAGGIPTVMSVPRPPAGYFQYPADDLVPSTTASVPWLAKLSRILGRHLPQAVVGQRVEPAPHLLTRCERFLWSAEVCPSLAIPLYVPVSFCPHMGGTERGALNARRAFAAAAAAEGVTKFLRAPLSDGVVRRAGVILLPAWQTLSDECVSFFATVARLAASTGDLRHSDGAQNSSYDRRGVPSWNFSARDIWATSGAVGVASGDYLFRRDAVPPQLRSTTTPGRLGVLPLEAYPTVDEFHVPQATEDTCYERVCRWANDGVLPQFVQGSAGRVYANRRLPEASLGLGQICTSRSFSSPLDHRRGASHLHVVKWSSRKRSGRSVNLAVTDNGITEPTRLVRREGFGGSVAVRAAAGAVRVLRAIRFVLATPSHPRRGYRESALTDYVGETEYAEVGDLGCGFEARRHVPNRTCVWPPPDGGLLEDEYLQLSTFCAENVLDTLSPARTIFDAFEGSAKPSTVRNIADLTGEDYDAATRLLAVVISVCTVGLQTPYAAEVLQWISLPCLLGGHRWRKKLASSAHIAMIEGRVWRGVSKESLLNLQRQLTRGIFLGSPSQLIMSSRPSDPVLKWRGRALPDFASLFRAACADVVRRHRTECATCFTHLRAETTGPITWLCRSCACRSIKLLSRGGGTLAFTRGESGMHAAVLAYEAERYGAGRGPIDTVERFLDVLHDALHDEELLPLVVRFPVWPNGQAGSREQECPGVKVGLAGVLLRAVFSRLIDDRACLPMREPGMAACFSGLTGKKNTRVLAADATAATERQSHESLAIMASFSKVVHRGVDLVPLALQVYTKYRSYEMRGDEWSVRAEGDTALARSEVTPTAQLAPAWVVKLPAGAKRL